MTELKIKTGEPPRARQAEDRLTLGKLLPAVVMGVFLLGLAHFHGLFDRLPEADRALEAALSRNDAGAAEAALRAGALVSRRDLTGGSYLHTAAYRGQVGVAEMLVEHGLDADVHDQAGVTPLHLAASEGHLEMADWLVRQGAKVDARTTAFVERCDGKDFQVGFTPLDVARQAGQQGLVDLLERAARR